MRKNVCDRLDVTRYTNNKKNMFQIRDKQVKLNIQLKIIEETVDKLDVIEEEKINIFDLLDNN